MSLDYAASLSPYPNKGKLGEPEFNDTSNQVIEKCDKLKDLIENSQHLVVITGAGLSTSCGIPDFRGPNGIWTLEKKGIKANSVSFQDALPSYSHHALFYLCKLGKIKFLISQNIDGLHMRSGFPMNRLAEPHGNMFIEKCNSCSSKYIMSKCVSKIGLKQTGNKCTRLKQKGNCRGCLLDTVLDWEDELPGEEMTKSELNCKKSDLILCLGTSLQIMPVGNYPLLAKKHQNGKIVIINLQKTRLDDQADLVINSKLDLVFEILFEKLNFNLKIEKLIQLNLKLESDEDEDKSGLLLSIKNFTIDSEYSKMELSFIPEPNLVLIISGKRKSGKDFISQKIVEYYKDKNFKFSLNLITISAPLKKAYAEENDLDYDKLLDSSDYKEHHRKKMIDWSEEKRETDPGYFCRRALNDLLESLKNNLSLKYKFKIFLVTDARRKTDMEYFKAKYLNQVKTIRVKASEEVRKQRNWTFTPGIDDSRSECDLDNYKFDFEIQNENLSLMNNSLDKLFNFINDYCFI